MRAVLNADGERLLVPLFGAVGLLFLIACANVSGLLLARGLQRQQEYATRAAMGAGRARLFRLVLIEAIALAMTAALLGAGAGVGDRGGAARHRRSGRPSGRCRGRRLAGPALRRPRRARGWHRRRAAAGAARLVGRSLHLLKGSRTTAGRVERRLLAGVAVVQVVLTVSLLAGAALLVRTAQKLDDVRPATTPSGSWR